ncbi:hypothetical protein AB2S62_07655 [Vibrio sp. NTOU-M3]|uniref:hypothetical protein n=1 Tax=Vibrio sp. NTOU-M3 TaxID=3234954 RepID=UPI00349FCD2F
MAAEKLTRVRFAQIIIMLTILVIAFFWRTWSYQEVHKFNCEIDNKCEFNVTTNHFVIDKKGEFVVISRPNMEWEISQLKDNTKSSNTRDFWKVNIEDLVQENNQIMLLNEKESYTIVVSFK